MSELSEEAAIDAFSYIITPILESGDSNAREILAACLAFYKDDRISNTDDSMMLEWGIDRPSWPPSRSDTFADLRASGMRWEYVHEKELPALFVGRQLFADRGDNDTKLEVDMWFTYCDWQPDLARGQRAFESWGLAETLKHVDEFSNHPFVSNLLDHVPDLTFAFADQLG